MLSNTQVLGSILTQTLGICWGLRTSSFLITSFIRMVLELGCLLDWLRTGVTGSPTTGLGVPSWAQDYLLPPGDWHLRFPPGADWVRKGGWGLGAVGGDSSMTILCLSHY